MRFLAIILIALFCVPSVAQYATSQNTIDVSGDAVIKVVPDRVRLSLGVETRNKDLETATTQNDAIVRRVLGVGRQFQVASDDMQTDYVHVDLAYDEHDNTLVSYYSVSKGVDIYLRDVSKFEPLLKAIFQAGANHVYEVEFSTSELRKYRDQARSLAVKAAIEKANDMATTAGLHVDSKPISISAYSYGGGSFSYGCCGYHRSSYQSQNVIQEIGGAANGIDDGSVALGKIPVSASVSLRFQLQ
ncbi:MAG TPA: SIMPL domain-containing protein [Terriglobales bacterium]|jgi:hypothetical protein